MNIVLIGMMGAGKTTVGRLISEKCSMKFIDMDDYIVEKNDMSIKKMFDIGEFYFRDKERDACRELSKDDNVVISCGGGVIKNHKNIEELKKNGIIFYIDRPIENIASDVNCKSRPLLKDGPEKLYEIFNERKDIYENVCDYRIDNSINSSSCAEQIIEIFREKVGIE